MKINKAYSKIFRIEKRELFGKFPKVSDFIQVKSDLIDAADIYYQIMQNLDKAFGENDTATSNGNGTDMYGNTIRGSGERKNNNKKNKHGYVKYIDDKIDSKIAVLLKDHDKIFEKLNERHYSYEDNLDLNDENDLDTTMDNR